MKQLNNFITEKLKINSKSKINQYNYFPNTSLQLYNILKERLSKDKNADLNDIDVSKITNMSNIFVKLDPHNINIENWDVSNVQNMEDMFYDCGNFNCDLSKWDVRNVINMGYMFFYCVN
ncbi:BspA family leucine-rich repeat surface protein, partial [bacterium]|nr:BspA family leucine-rich repeat surface protein [bacterium]